MKKHVSHILTLVLVTGVLSAVWSFQYVSPAEWGTYFKAQLNVGQTASVEENPMNKIAQELKNREEELDEREAELTKKEEFLIREIAEEQERRNMYIVGALIVVVVTVLMNFILDWKREEREEGMLRKILRRTNSNE